MDSYIPKDSLQYEVMGFITTWVKQNKTTVPKNIIIGSFVKGSIKRHSVLNALYVLSKKGYIRRATTLGNKTSYVQLRSF